MKELKNKQRAPRNRTITLSDVDILRFKKNLIKLDKPTSLKEIENKTIYQDIFEALEYLPDKFVDLVFVDPPYNLNKTFNLTSFKAMESEKYEEWLDSWIQKIIRLLKPSASVYICGDWKSSGAIFNVAKKYFQIQNLKNYVDGFIIGSALIEIIGKYKKTDSRNKNIIRFIRSLRKAIDV